MRGEDESWSDIPIVLVPGNATWQEETTMNFEKEGKKTGDIYVHWVNLNVD